jgi:MYXO-CTERM domain-containing protein
MRNRVLVAALTAVAFACTSQAQVIDFQVLEHNDNNIADHGTVYDEDGYRLTKGQGEPFNFASFGTQESRYPGSTALFNNTVDGIITLQRIDGAPFDLISIDIAILNGPGTVNVTFTANTGAMQTHTRTEPDFPLNLETFNFNAGFQNILSVSWVQQSPFHQFDNIVVRPIPAPAALGLLGLAGVAARRRRRE